MCPVYLATWRSRATLVTLPFHARPGTKATCESTEQSIKATKTDTANSGKYFMNISPRGGKVICTGKDREMQGFFCCLFFWFSRSSVPDSTAAASRNEGADERKMLLFS